MTKHDYLDTLEYINQNIFLLDIIEGYGLKVIKESDGRYKMICPFHNEDTPSFKIYNNKNKQTFFCFGCGAGYSVIDFIKMHEDISFMEVINRYKNLTISGGGESIFQKIVKYNSNQDIDLSEYTLSSKFRLGIILRECLKNNPERMEFIDRCFFEMDNFFENLDNMDKDKIDYFETSLLERINEKI